MISAASMRWSVVAALPCAAGALPLARGGSIAAAAVVLAVGIGIFLTLGLLRDIDAPYAAHIDGLPARRLPKPRTGRRAKWVAIAIVLIDLSAAPVTTSAVVAVTFAAVGVLFALAMAMPLGPYLTNRHRIRRAISAHAPVVALPYGGRVYFHIPMWTPYVRRSGLPYVVIAKNRERFVALSTTNDDPIVAPTRVDRMADVFPSSLRVALYVHNAPRNDRFLAQGGICHVFVGHGESDKPGSASPSIGRYDLIVAAGQANIDRFAAAGIDIGGDRFRILGRPQTEDFAGATEPISAVADPVVLYAPTWPHQDPEQNLSSVFVGEAIVQRLLGLGHTVIFRRHLAGRYNEAGEEAIGRIDTLLATHAEAAGKSHVWGSTATDMPLAAAFNASNAMITDVSGIAADYLATGKPLAMVAVGAVGAVGADTIADHDSMVAAFHERYQLSRAAYVIDLDSLDCVLADMFGADPLSAARSECHRHYLGALSGADSVAAFIDFLHTAASTSSP